MNIAVLDDLEYDRMWIRQQVLECFARKGIRANLFPFSSGEAFLEAYQPNAFSIVLLDVYMKDLDGMAVAYRLREYGDDCQLVFVTSSEASAVESYDVGAAYYLLKPLEPARLERALDLCLKRLGSCSKTIEIMSNRLLTKVPVHSILWVNTFQNAVLLHTDGGVLKTYMTFDRFIRLLEEDREFLLCYKGCLVNMNRISSIQGDDFLMENGDLVQIRKRGSNQIKRAYTQYLCGI